jgi:hypothetical protein
VIGAVIVAVILIAFLIVGIIIFVISRKWNSYTVEGDSEPVMAVLQSEEPETMRKNAPK